MEQFLSAVDVANQLKISYRTVENWAAKGYLERKEGKYGLNSAFKYRIEQLEEEVNGLKDNPKAELQVQKLVEEVSERKAIARIKTLEADKLEGRLIDADQALNTWKNTIAKVKAKLISIPPKLALQLSGIDNPKEIQSILRTVIDEALQEFGASQ